MSKFGRRINKVKKYLRRDFPEVYENFSVEIKRFNNPKVGDWEFSCKYKNKYVFSWGFSEISYITSESFYTYTKGNFLRKYCKVICKIKKRN